MSLLTPGKTNWKFLALVITLAIFIGGGILFWYFKEIRPLLEIRVPEKVTPPLNLEKNFLWVVEGEENKVYLLGSIHLLKKEDYPLPPAIEQIYNCCQKLVFETDIEALEDPAFQSKIMEKMYYPSEETLFQNISEDTLKLLEEKLTLPLEHFEKIKPWALSLMIAIQELQRLGYEMELGIDNYFYKKAKSDNKEIVYLETPEFQIETMAKLEKTEQELLLRKTLRELDIIKSEASKIVNAWKRGNIEEIGQITKSAFQDFPEIYDIFFVQRNKKWVNSIEKFLKEKQDILIIVGAGHFGDKDGLINLLKEKGYKVEQK